MNKRFILLMLLIASIKNRVFYTPFMKESHSISEISQMDMELLDCSIDFLQMSQSIKAWQEILENEKELDTDIQSLKSIQAQVEEFRQLLDHRQIFAQIKTSVLTNMREEDILDLSPYQQWRNEGLEGLQRQLNLLDQARSINESQECCDMIEKLIEKLLSEREKIKTECQQSQITINIINSKAIQVSKKQEQCEAQGVQLDGLKDKDKTKNKKIPEKQESFSESEQQEEVNTDAKENIYDINIEEPVQVSADDEENTKHKNISEKQEYQLKQTDKKHQTADSYIINNKSFQDQPFMEKQINTQQNLQEYGYGYWMRFLTIYPDRLENGKNLPLYYVSGLTTKESYENIKMSDRALAIWQGRVNYIFVSGKTVIFDPNSVSSINYPTDIEGVWTYIYYSYSVQHQKAMGFIKFGDSDFQTVVQSVTHPNTNFLRFIQAGNDDRRFPGFNGLFTRVIFNDQLGAYIAQLQILQQLIDSQGPTPLVIAQDLISKELINGIAERYPTDDLKVIQVTDARLPHEYAISGWFKFVQPTNQATWHSAFRVQITTPGKDGTLGDRVLMYELGINDIQSSTYTYTNMNGAGTANLPKTVPHQNRPYEWHFVYQGYSKQQQFAYFIAKFTNSQESFSWTDTKQYYSGQFHIQLGSTHFLQGWSGYHAFVSFHTGKGAFKVGNDYGDPQDRFKQIAATNSILNPGYQKPQPTTYPAQLESKSSQEEPLMDKQINVQQNFLQYGYGFWLRFLTIYPERLSSGKNLPLYFISRLTTNQPYGNSNMGDRTLAIWQGQVNYLFATCNTINGNTSVESFINFPADIEGIWTYVYYSYSVADQKAQGFIKFGESGFQTVVQPVAHPNTNQLRFILGGNDAKRYPGFNGLFTRVIFNDQLGAYISSSQILQQLVASQGPTPSVIAQDLISQQLVDGVAEKYPTDDIKVIQLTDARLPHEYAISGWFKFVKPSIQSAYHTAFRVQVTTPGKDYTLGDRVFIHAMGNIGEIFISTYTYTNMNGAGNSNMNKDYLHQNRSFQWHFVYQGYSKPLSLTYYICKFTNTQESFQWTNTKHYYPGQFHILLGSTHFRPSWNGQHAFISFHTGQGAFKDGNDFLDPQDRFKQTAALNSILIPLSTTQKQKKCLSSLLIDCSQQ